MSATGELDLVQAIAVVPSSHHETITAVAIASALSVIHADRGDAPWSTWLDQEFTKSVRRIRRPAEQERIALDPDVTATTIVGRATAYAFTPMPYSAFPAQVRRLQVSGLDRRSEQDPTSWETPIGESVHEGPLPLITLESAVGMSTGKAAAQAAHALCSWAMALPAEQASTWAHSPRLRLVERAIGPEDLLCSDLPGQHATIVIRDAGRTEIDPDTVTALVCMAPD